MFKIIGAADATANLLCEFRIAEKNDAKLIKNKKGKVILVKEITISIFELSPTKPGAIKNIKMGIKISTIKTIKNKIMINKLKISVANSSDLSLP